MAVVQKLSNGLTVLVEEMPHVESVSYDLLIPGGILSDSPETIGSSLLLAELTSRGAGDLDSRGLADAFEDIGARHGEGASLDKFAYSGSLIADRLPEALGLVSKMVQQPILPEEEIENIASILLQDISSVFDSPARHAMYELGKRYYPAPFNRPGIGEREGIEKSTVKTLRDQWKKCFRPSRAILSVAGNIGASNVIGLSEKLFGDWTGVSDPLPKFPGFGPAENHHITTDSAQLQIAVIMPSVTFGHPLYYAAKVAMGMLSGGMFGRLFIEVREKRGLCYSVYARHASNVEYGTVMAYAGTTPERAHDTLSVLLEVIRGLRGSVTDEELKRAKANIKAALVIGEESPGSRASSNAIDWWLTQRIRTLPEIQAGIDAVTPHDIDKFLEEFPTDPHTLLTLGARALV